MNRIFLIGGLLCLNVLTGCVAVPVEQPAYYNNGYYGGNYYGAPYYAPYAYADPGIVVEGGYWGGPRYYGGGYWRHGR